MRVLLIEDDLATAAFLRAGLAEAGHEMDWAATGAEGLEAVKHNEYEAILLDLTLPGGISGHDVAAEFRRCETATPVIILTAQNEVGQVVRGLDLADDYVTKPFQTQELLARLRAHVRRARLAPQPILRLAGIELDQIADEVSCCGEPIRLTPIEFRLLRVLMAADGEVRSREQLLGAVWGINFTPGTNLVDVHLTHLRQKLEASGRPRVIATVRGEGFRMKEPEAMAS